MKTTSRILLLLMVVFSLCTAYCNAEKRSKNPVPLKFKKVQFAKIPGAPKFQQPQLLVDDKGEVIRVEKIGHAYPALMDVNNDGRLDLLVGEFSGGKDANVKVFVNVGTQRKPVFSSESYYLKDKTGEPLYINGY